MNVFKVFFLRFYGYYSFSYWVRPKVSQKTLLYSTYSNATRYANQSLQQCYASNENEKKRKYNNRVMDVELGCFTPLVFSANGGMSPECKKFYSRLAETISAKRKEEYDITIS